MVLVSQVTIVTNFSVAKEVDIVDRVVKSLVVVEVVVEAVVVETVVLLELVAMEVVVVFS